MKQFERELENGVVAVLAEDGESIVFTEKKYGGKVAVGKIGFVCRQISWEHPDSRYSEDEWDAITDTVSEFVDNLEEEEYE